jgi:hypothetical protein
LREERVGGNGMSGSERMNQGRYGGDSHHGTHRC